MKSILHALMAGSACFLAFANCGMAQPAVAPVPEELLVRRSQPAVFMALASGDGEVTYPAAVSVKVLELNKEFSEKRTAGESMTAFFWSRIAASPGTYLECSANRNTRKFADQIYASGTAFAVSREGILLTNAHVIADPDTETLTAIVAQLDLVREPFAQAFRQVADALGGAPPAQIAPSATQSVAEWYAAQCSVSGKFKRVLIALKFGTNQKNVMDIILAPLGSIKKEDYMEKFLAAAKPQPITRPAVVLAVGKPFPGKDVAVLRIVMDDQDERSAAERGLTSADADALRRVHQNDRLICLPLGDSDAVLPGAQIHALGFPGAAFVQEVMDPSARFRVSSETGEIGQTKRITGGWDALEMTAEINHGDSGGPVIDKHGNVIGINVWGAMVGHKIAVPINVAKEFLKQAGITPDPGPISRLWDEGLRLYGEGKFAEASAKFTEVRDKQEGIVRTRFMPVSPFTTVASPYVEEMWFLCEKALGKVK